MRAVVIVCVCVCGGGGVELRAWYVLRRSARRAGRERGGDSSRRAAVSVDDFELLKVRRGSPRWSLP